MSSSGYHVNDFKILSQSESNMNGCVRSYNDYFNIVVTVSYVVGTNSEINQQVSLMHLLKLYLGNVYFLIVILDDRKDILSHDFIVSKLQKYLFAYKTKGSIAKTMVIPPLTVATTNGRTDVLSPDSVNNNFHNYNTQ